MECIRRIRREITEWIYIPRVEVGRRLGLEGGLEVGLRGKAACASVMNGTLLGMFAKVNLLTARFRT